MQLEMIFKFDSTRFPFKLQDAMKKKIKQLEEKTSEADIELVFEVRLSQIYVSLCTPVGVDLPIDAINDVNNLIFKFLN